MKQSKTNIFSYMVAGLVAGVGITSMQGCDNLAAQCGLVCPDAGIAEGNASISGIASIDGFFGAVVDVKAAADGIQANVQAELDGLAALVGLPAGSAAADIRGALEAKFAASISGGLKIDYEPAACEVNLEVSASAAAECDVDVDPGEVSVKCEGGCTIDAEASAECSASGELKCTGTAPNLECSGSCTGECRLDVAASCEGTCRGECMGECSVTDSMGNCAGACDGMCQGSCQLEAGGSCSGSCEGSCEYTPPDGMCEASAEVRCEAMANAEVECKGGCEGKAEPPMVKAECQAQVEAKAEASASCTPPSVAISWQWSADLEGDVNAQAEFKAFIEGFKMRFGALLAASARIEGLVTAGEGLVAAAGGAVKGSVEALTEGDLDLKIIVGAGCAIDELPMVGAALNGSLDSIKASGTAIAEISASVGG